MPKSICTKQYAKTNLEYATRKQLRDWIAELVQRDYELLYDFCLIAF